MTDFADLALNGIVADLRREPSATRFRDAALACVEQSYRLGGDDLAKPDLMTAGMTFATLALVETLTTTGAGRNIADAVASGLGIQP